jgi:hypothetical protein
MKKWYAILPMLIASIIFAGCSSETDDSSDTAPVEDAASTDEASAEDSSRDDAAQTAESAEGSHSHGDGEAHSHAPVVSELGAVLSKLDGSTTMEIGCGSCSYGMDGVKDCVLAAVINDEPFLVTGVDFDAHANGLCKATKTATISGNVHADGIVATKIELTD